jgi:hypothetical protein
MVHPSGVEPDTNTSKHKENSASGHKKGYTSYVAVDSELKKIIVAWVSLPAAIKAAILAIVGSVNSSAEVKS